MTTSITLPMLDLPEGSLERQLGSLLLQKGGQKLSLPLQGVDIRAKVVDRVAEVTIKQVFRNSHNEHLEAVYIFPMAAGSAVSNFSMHVGDRKIKGVVQERAEARQQYQQAVAAGKRAALLEQERDDVFTVQVGNLPPGEEVTIEITYSERLPFFEDGKTELRLPLVVAPRYIPGQALNRTQVGDGVEHDTDEVPDASRITPPRLAQGVDPETALKLQVEILPDDDGELSDMACSQHATKAGISRDGIIVGLAKTNERLNRDFVLRWSSTGASVKSKLMTFTAEDGETYGILSIQPPKRGGFLGAARDVVFVLDRSGSMQGIKMVSAVKACNILLNTLGPRDRFAIAAFDNSVMWMPGVRGTNFCSADIAGIEKGENFLRTVEARGGTELNPALQEVFHSLRQRHDAEGRMPAIVILTDGEVGNESAILQRIQQNIGDARLFVVGIDTSVNSGLLKRLANLGGGTATFVEPGIQLEEALASTAREIGAPVVSDLQLEDLDLKVDRASVSPSRIPDVFQGRSSLAFIKLTGPAKGKITVRGRYADGKVFEEKVKAQKVEMPAIAQLWAKSHILELEDAFRLNKSAAHKKMIIDIAVKHQLLTKFTAFVVVDEAEIVNKTGDLHKVVQAVETPESWEMESQAPAPALKKMKHLAMMDVAAEGRMRSLSKAAPDAGLVAGAGAAPGAPHPSLAESIRQQVSKLGESLKREVHTEAFDASQAEAEADAGSGSSGWGDLAAGAGCAGVDADAWGAPSQQQAGGWGASPPVANDSWSAPESQATDGWGAPAPAPQELCDSLSAWSDEEEKIETGMWKAASPKADAAESAPPAPGAPSPSPQPSMQAPSPQAPTPPARKAQSRDEASSGAFNQSSGSYGMGVRQQVFEVVVRQALNGAPWQEICGGPMQVNNITPEEVQAEVDRRRGLGGNSGSSKTAPPNPPAPPTMGNIFKRFGDALAGKRKDEAPTDNKYGGEIDSIRKLLTEFLSVFEQAFVVIAKQQKPDEAKLESARVKLLQALAPLTIGMDCPETQRFLRSTAIELVGSLKDQSVKHEDLTEFWNTKKDVFESVKAELDRVLNGKEASFWDSMV